MDERVSAPGETRYDPVHDRWTIYAPGRAGRPHAIDAVPRLAPRRRRDAGCPFCPGNEDLLPSVLRERRAPSAGLWSTRVVPNRYPIVAPGAHELAGCHEVVIETPRHDLDLARLEPADRRAVVATWRDRYRDLAQRWVSVVILRNYGPRGGASLAHPHSQMVALDRPTPAMAGIEARAARHHRRTGRALVHETLERELDDGRRMVAGNGAFGCFVPYWAEVPYEIWIVPRRRQADFGTLADDEVAELADSLGETLLRLSRRAEDPAYNLTIHGATRGQRRAIHACWFVRIRPRIGGPGGFEIASGMAVNPSLPELDAARLR